VSIPIIDLFAGPGGLGEGFTSVTKKNGGSFFDIKLSIEKDKNAHKTLTWRSFYRQFKKNNKIIPQSYYDVLYEKDINVREEMIEEVLSKYKEGDIAKNESRLVELGSDRWPSDKVDKLIKKQLGNKKKWVLIGGPPCQAYSNVGRSRVGGIRNDDHRVYLYEEYLRIIKKHSPTIFVMENVKGLLSAKVNDEFVFDWIKRDLKVDGEYTIHSFVKPVKEDKDFLIKSELFGIPQKRHRVIILGIRRDIKFNQNFLQEKPKISIYSAISDLPKIRSKLNRKFIRHDNQKKIGSAIPKRIYERVEDSQDLWEKLFEDNINKINSWNDFSRMGKNHIKSKNLQIGSEFLKTKITPKESELKDWYFDKKLNGACNHSSRSHLTQDLLRYLFSTIYAKKFNVSPKLSDFENYSAELLPDHANAASGKFIDRFKVQVKDDFSSTITSHISKDGHYFIHYDPAQCRSISVREAARIQTFPDNYLFRGPRTSQYHQVGNAVPPYLAYQIGLIVKEILI
tara:strand:- start:4099 stop:5631 length:1533 start_codon:yes stop_codon:yes gene_type:complete